MTAAQPPNSKNPIWPGTLALLAAVLLAYAPALAAGWIWDDPDYVLNNPTLRNLSGLWTLWSDVRSLPQWYPMVHTSFWAEYQLWGLWPAGFHATNILLHATAAILLWRALRLLALPGALAAAFFFALHPVQVESVAWVTERKNVLSAVFYLAAFITYWRWLQKRSIALYLAASALFVAALLSKSVTCSLPAALLLVLWWKKRLQWRRVVELLPWFALGLAMALLTAHLEKEHVGAAGAEWALSMAQRVLVAGRALWFYLGKLLWPWPLIFIYPRWTLNPALWWQWLFPALAVAAAAGLFLLRRHIGRGPVVAACFFAGTLTPALGFFNIFPMRYSYVADHFQYLACIGVLVPLAWLCARFGPRWLAAALAGAWAILGFVQCFNYADSLTLWRATAAGNPDSWMVHVNLAASLSERAEQIADPARREDFMRQAFDQYDQARRLGPQIPEVQWNWAIAQSLQGRNAEAHAALAEALRLQPSFPEALLTEANLYAAENKIELADAYYRQALSARARFPIAHYNYAIFLESRGEPDRAEQHYRASIVQSPAPAAAAKARYNLANLLLKVRRLDDAISQYEMLIEERPDWPQARVNYGAALLQSGKISLAAAQFTAALRLNPNLEPARRGLAACERLR